MENQTQERTQTVDVDIKALVEQAKSKSPQEKVEEKSADDVLKKLGMKPAEVETTKTEADEPVDDAEALKAQQEALKKQEKAEAKKELELKKVIGNEWKSRLNTLIEDGLIEDVAITLDPGTENEKSVYLSELEDLDAATYKSIVNNYKEAKDKELKEKYISVEGLDDTTKKLVNLKKEGGDISTLIQEEVQVIDTLQRIQKSLDDENEQARVVYHDLLSKGVTKRVAEVQIQELAENFQLENTARDIIKKEIDAYEESVEQKQKEQLKQLEIAKEEHKAFTKEVSAKYKEWGVEENLRRLLVQNTTVRDQNGLTNTDKLYFDSIKDPEKHAKVAFLLNNLEKFEEHIAGKRVVEDKKRTVSSLFTLSTTNIKQADRTSDDKTDKLIAKLKM
jgi:hypothetical protein